jgi:predicted amidohydrolase
VRRVRLVAVGLRFDPARVVDQPTFAASIAATFDAAAGPSALGSALGPGRLGAEVPTLVAFPEHTGLLAMLAGEGGEAARRTLASGGSTVEALTALAVSYGAQLGHLAGVFPEADAPGQLLHLALTDTVVEVLSATFGSLARDRGVWVSVGAALPDWEDVTGQPAITLRGPDAAGEHAYAATSAAVRNRNLLFGPDGTLVTIQDKAYLVPMERDRAGGLGLAAAAVDGIEVVDLPLGRLGSVISKDAWMVDVNDRLDQLGAQVVVQPEAFDRWAEVDRARGQDGEEVADLWPPDKFQRGGWWMVQRHPSLVANVTPVLLGALGELRFDGQPLVAVPAPGGEPGLGLLGQPPDDGWAAVGPWWRAPETPTELADAARRGAPAPAMGAADTDVLAWADVAVPTPPPPSPSPPRPPRLAPSVEVATVGTTLVPDLAVVEGAPVLAAVAGDRAGRQEVVALRWDGQSWSAPDPVAPAPTGTEPPFDRQWRPRLVAGGAGLVCLHLGFPAESWDLFASVGTGAGWSPPTRVDDAHRDAGVLRERGHDAPAVVANDGVLVAVWSDLRWPWVFPQVRVARSEDGGRSWSASQRVDGRSLAGQPDPLAPRHRDETRGQTAPAIAVTAEGLVVAWQERSHAGAATTWVATGADDASWSPPRRLDVGDGGARARWRPALAATARTCWLVEEVAAPEGGSRLEVRVSGDAGRRWTAPVPLDPDRPAGVTQRRAAVVATGPDAVVVFEDDRAGRSCVHAVTVDGHGRPGPLRRLDDTPAPGHARAPTAVRCGTSLLVAWQDTRGTHECVRALEVPLAALAAPLPEEDPRDPHDRAGAGGGAP